MNKVSIKFVFVTLWHAHKAFPASSSTVSLYEHVFFSLASIEVTLNIEYKDDPLAWCHTFFQGSLYQSPLISDAVVGSRRLRLPHS